jgi:hypothetical protein
MTKPSSLWSDLKGNFDYNSKEALESFRRPNSPNNRLASWDPTDPTSRHFKFLIWNKCEEMSDRFFEILAAIPRRDIGNPVSIAYRGQSVDIDYALSVDECLFLESNSLKPNTIIEVGAGFGRTAHSILSIFPSVTEYIIVDLPEVLQLSRLFLSEVLSPAQFKRVKFFNALADWSELSSRTFDLFINIDSFQEMDSEVILDYEKKLMRNSSHVYLKQPIGKYRPEEFDIPTPKKRADVLELGLSREVFTLCDEKEYRRQLERHLKNYSFSGRYKLLSHTRCSFFHFYEHSLYVMI